MSNGTPKTLVIRTAGTNCDAELVRAFERAGSAVELVHVDALLREPARIEAFDLIGFPGGFSYGDDIASGRVLAMKLRERLYPVLRDAAQRGVPMIGVCNGFQVMVQVGLLPGPIDGVWPEAMPPAPTVALEDNDTARFMDRWVEAECAADSVCLWTRGISDDGSLMLPVANGEGRFTASESVIDSLEARGQVALRYSQKVNGSAGQIAGICDVSGRIFGLMPHPERFVSWHQHPWWTRLDVRERGGITPGLRVFENAVGAVRECNRTAGHA